jgi:hypothetical protein
MKERNRKGQEEMVGFVVIVVLVAVVFLVFLGLFVSKGVGNDQDSREIIGFLESLNQYTSDCAISFEPAFEDIGSLVQECYEGSLCLNGKSACDVLNGTVREVLDSSWNIGPEDYHKAYVFKVYFDDNSTKEDIMEVSKGDCLGSIIGAEIPISEASGLGRGSFVESLRICT